MNRWYVNGSGADAVGIGERATQYGDGLFETVAVRNGQPRLWDYHVDRLQTGCERLGLAAPARDDVAERLASALRQSGVAAQHCTAKIIVSAGTGQRGYRRPQSTAAQLWIGVFDATPVSRSAYESGVIARCCKLRLSCQPHLAGIKSLNRLEQVLARNEWHDETIFEGLTLDTGARLICGTMSNVFLVLDRSLVTPAITRCGVSGVMRRHVLTLCDEGGYDCDVRDVTLDDLDRCDELLLTNSQFGVLPVRQCGERAWNAPGPVTRKIMQLAARSGIEECAA